AGKRQAPNVPVHTLCRRRKPTAECLGRSPDSEVQSVLCGGFTFPGCWPSGRSKPRPHSQWRDRAGFTPDFPVMPLAGTQTRRRLYHERRAIGERPRMSDGIREEPTSNTLTRDGAKRRRSAHDLGNPRTPENREHSTERSLRRRRVARTTSNHHDLREERWAVRRRSVSGQPPEL